MDIGCVGIIGTEQDGVKQVYDRSLIISVLYIYLHRSRRIIDSGGCSLLSCLSCSDLRVIILDRIFQGHLLSQHYLQIHAHHLTDILYSIEIKRIIYQHKIAAAIYTVTHHAVFLGQHSGDHLHGLNIHVQILDIH